MNDFATAFALATSGLLASFAEADSFLATTFASADSHFVGTIVGGGPPTLHLVFASLSTGLGGGAGDATLAVLLTNTLGAATTTLFDSAFVAGGVIDLQFVVPAGGISTLDLDLFSEAFTLGAGQAGQNSSQVTFGGTIGGTIPLPARPLLILEPIRQEWRRQVRRHRGRARAW